MKKLFILISILGAACLCCAQTPGTVTTGPGNDAGLLYASSFGQWQVQQGNTGQFSWSSPSFCTVTASGMPLNPVFAVGSPIYIKDSVSANSEIVTPSAVNVKGFGCSITVSPSNPHISFMLTSATAGLQEAINYANGLLYQVILTPDWTRLGGTTAMITSAVGSSQVSILDERTSHIVAYMWNGSAYVQNPSGSGTVNAGTAGQIAYYPFNGAAVSGENVVAIAQGGTSATTAPQALENLINASGGLEPIPGIINDSINCTNDTSINAVLGTGGDFILPTNKQLTQAGSGGGTICFSNTLDYVISGTVLAGGGGESNLGVASSLYYHGSSTSFGVSSVTKSGNTVTVYTTTLPTYNGEFVSFTGITGLSGLNSYGNNFQAFNVNPANGTFTVWYSSSEADGTYTQSTAANYVTSGDAIDVGCAETATSSCTPVHLRDFNIYGLSNSTGVGINFGSPGAGSSYNGNAETLSNVSINGFPQAMYLQGVNAGRIDASVHGTAASTNLFLVDVWKNGTGNDLRIQGCSGPSGAVQSVAAGCVRVQTLSDGMQVHFAAGNNTNILLWVGNYSQGPWSAQVLMSGTGSGVTATLTSGGYGYPQCPTLVFSGGGGSGLAYSVTCVGAPGNIQVSSITQTSGGTGYTSTPSYAFFIGNIGEADVYYSDMENVQGYFGFADYGSQLNVRSFQGTLTSYPSVGPMFYASAHATIDINAIPGSAGTFAPAKLVASAGGSYAAGTYYFFYEGYNPCTQGGPWNTFPSISSPITTTVGSQYITVTPQAMGATCAGVLTPATYNIYLSTDSNVTHAVMIAANVSSPYVSSGNETLSPAPLGTAPASDNRPLWYAADATAIVTCTAATPYSLTSTGLTYPFLATGELSNGEYVQSCNPGVVDIPGANITHLPGASAKNRSGTYCLINASNNAATDSCYTNIASSNGTTVSYNWQPNSASSLLASANTWSLPQTFTPSNAGAGLNVGSMTGNPLAHQNGDLWYNQSSNSLDAYINGVITSLGSGGSGMVYPGAGVAVSTGSGWGTSLNPVGGFASLGANNIFTNINYFNSASYLYGGEMLVMSTAALNGTNQSSPNFDLASNVWTAASGGSAQTSKWNIQSYVTNANDAPNILKFSLSNTGSLASTGAIWMPYLTITGFSTAGLVTNTSAGVLGTSAVIPVTAPTAGQILVGNAANTAYNPVTMSGSCTMASTGVITCSGGGTVTTSGSPVSPNIAAFSSSTAITAATSANIQTAIGAGVYDASGAAAARQANLSLVAGTYADGKMCTYASSGTLLNCNTTIPAAQVAANLASSGSTGVTGQLPIGQVGSVGLSASNGVGIASTGAITLTYGTTANTAAQGNDSRITGAVQSGGALGTPSSGVITNLTGTCTSCTANSATSVPAANVASGALANGMAATTQTAGDNSTKLATTAYVATAVTYPVANTTFTTSTGSVGANTCNSTVQVAMTGVTTGMTFLITASADTSAATGWGSTGGLVLDVWPTAGYANYKICNQTAASVTPTAVTFNIGAR